MIKVRNQAKSPARDLAGATIRLLELLILLISVLVCEVGAVSGAQSFRQGLSLEALSAEAQSDFAKQDYVSAAKKYEHLAALQPASADVLNNLGVTYHFLGRWQDAVATLTKALRLSSTLQSANLILGIDLVRLGRLQEAIPPLEQVLRQQPHQRDALLALASANMGLQRFDSAADSYRRITEFLPSDFDAWHGLGLCFERIAEATTRLMAGIGKDSPSTERLVGEFLIEQGSSFDAEAAFRRALASDAEQPRLHAGLGFVHLSLGELERARQEFATELKLYPSSLPAKLGTAAVSIEQGYFASGLEAVCEVHKTDSGYFEAQLDLFLASLRKETQSRLSEFITARQKPTGCEAPSNLLMTELTSPQLSQRFPHAFESLTAPSDRAAALVAAAFDAARVLSDRAHYGACAEKLQSLPPHSIEVALLLGQCACLSGRFYTAYQAADGVTIHEPQNLEALYWKAEATRNLARAAFQRAVRLNPNAWQAHLLLADIYSQRKNWNLAISHYKAAERLQPSSPAPHLGLGALYWKTGKNDDAEKALKETLEKDPDNPTANFVLGDVYVRQHRLDEAIPLLRKHLARNPDTLAAHAGLGKAYAASGKTDEAIAELLRALPMDRFGDLHFQLYKLYKSQGNETLAQEALEESNKIRAQERLSHQKRTERAAEATSEK